MLGKPLLDDAPEEMSLAPRHDTVRSSARAGWGRVALLAALGLLAVAGLLGFYLAVITLAQGLGHALEQLSQDLWFVAAIAAGFGTQVGLFTYLRRLHAGTGAATAVSATGTGTGTVSMLACCAHHLTDILPVVGVSGAAFFLAEYRTPFMLLGIVVNVLGVVYMVRLIRRRRLLNVVPSPQALSCHDEGLGSRT